MSLLQADVTVLNDEDSVYDDDRDDDQAMSQ